ncbi:MAG: TATA box-binding protein, partial [Thermoprotei archaeon]
ALNYLTKIGVEHSLRYAVQLLAPASIVAKYRNSDIIEVEDIKKATELFSDVKRSAKYLKEYEESFMK